MEKKYQSIAEFSSLLVHDLRNDLQLINILTEVLNDKEYLSELSPDEMLEEIKKLQDSIFKMGDSLTAMSQFTKDSKILHEKTSLSKLIESIYSDFHRDLQLNIDNPSGHSLTVNCNYESLKDALTEFVVNAKEHHAASKEDKKIIINIIKEVKEKNVIIEFINYGKLMDNEKINSIFKPFYSSKNKKGIGLSLAKQIIKDHKGEILVKAEKDHNKFTIKMPVDDF